MAEPAVLELGAAYCSSSFDFPAPYNSELCATPDLDLDLDFEDLDFDVDFSIDELLQLPKDQDFFSLDAPPGTDPCSSGVSSSSSSTQLSGNQRTSISYPDFAHSAASCVASIPEVKFDDPSNARNGSTGLGLKRKKGSGNGNADFDHDLKGGKAKRSAEDGSSVTCVGSEEDEEEHKRRARLMRNRGSAQLSRQRKKHYVEALEEKVRAMHSTINELNSRISFVMAENSSLRQHLGASGGTNGAPPPPAVYPLPMAPMHFPWNTCSRYALRPNGTQVPLVPIPRLKPQQPALVPKAKKSESKKVDSKTKKVASISLLGLFFVVLVFGGVRFKYDGDGDSISGGSRGRILSVTGHSNGLSGTDEIGLSNVNMSLQNGGLDPVTGKRCQAGSWPSNSSEPLPALLYVPRNGRHVKINGNLIIHSVLASEKAMAHASSRVQSGDQGRTSGKDVRETGLAIHRNVVSSLVVPRAGRDVERHSNVKRSSSEDKYGDSFKSTHADGPLQQWFREGLAGPILSSGMCTEVFQFDVSQVSANPSGVVPATSIINSTTVNSTSNMLPHQANMKNRRILYPQLIPLTGSTLNNTDHSGKPSSESSSVHGNNSASSMVVSVLADPREAGDGHGDGMMPSPKSLSRIFVVVLIDSVKYVTYSCVIPLKSSSQHLVN